MKDTYFIIKFFVTFEMLLRGHTVLVQNPRRLRQVEWGHIMTYFALLTIVINYFVFLIE